MIAALGLLLGACNRQATPKTDLDRLQGTWYLASAMQDGKALPEDKVKQTTIVFKGDTFRFPGSAEYATSRAGTIKLDETKTPKEMGCHLYRERSHARHLRAGRERLQGVLRPGRQAASHRIHFHAGEWSDPPGLAAAEQAVTASYRSEYWEWK
jgi:uncharacterized protein (TIGR03067 family)